jgi:hypothetical protein
MGDLEGVRAAAGPCPSCGARLARPIVWGLPDFTDVERWGDSVAFGGCCIPSFPPPEFSCAACGAEWSQQESAPQPR